MQNEKVIYVYFNKDSNDILMGKLYIENLRGKEIYSFEYDEKYLEDKNNNIFIDPEIKFYSGRQWKTNNSLNSDRGNSITADSSKRAGTIGGNTSIQEDPNE